MKMWKINHLLLVYWFSVFYGFIIQVRGEACLPIVGPFRRVGNTEYYIAHEQTRGNFVDHEGARVLCESNGLSMATIPDMQTMAVLGRTLESLVEAEKLKDTWYWLDATYDDASERYKWGKDTTGQDVKFSTFLYRKYRPTGLASFVNWRGKYKIDQDVKQCLTLALPWPGPWDPNKKGVLYGHQTLLDERPCKSKKTRHAMCESKTNCDPIPQDPFVLGINQGTNDYFEFGNWILGDRKYIINWEHRTLEDTELYCKGLGLEVVDPGIVKPALIPFLKMWSRNLTVSQFWTGLKYEAKSKKFKNRNGVEIGKQKIRVEFKDGAHEISIRSNKNSQEFCVALSFSYEFKTQAACEDTTSCMSWSFIDYIPANCNNYLASICQHANQKDRSELRWESNYLSEKKGINRVLAETATTKEFGYTNNTSVVRSKYKQTFGSFVCPQGYRMVRDASARKWWLKPKNVAEESLYIYDYKETYWVVDEHGFNKGSDSDCIINFPDPVDGDGHTRATREVECVKWHFYLCEVSNRPMKKKIWKTPSIPTMEWSEKRQPRIYPLVNK